MTPAQLKAARQKLGLSHDRLSRKIGVSARQLFRYEKGEAKVPKVVGLAMRYLTAHARS